MNEVHLINIAEINHQVWKNRLIKDLEAFVKFARKKRNLYNAEIEWDFENVFKRKTVYRQFKTSKDLIQSTASDKVFPLPFNGDDEANNAAFIEIMRYLKYDYYVRYYKG